MGMTAPDLLIDIGNSRVKWALTPPHHAGAPAEDEAAAHQGDPAGIVALLPECRPARIAVSQVLGAEVGARLGLALQSRYGIAPVLARVRPDHCGLRIAYPDPARLGVDRWLAMLAARRLSLAQPVIIAMAGTALTLDVVDAHGRHLGGFIPPGAPCWPPPGSTISRGKKTLPAWARPPKPAWPAARDWPAWARSTEAPLWRPPMPKNGLAAETPPPSHPICPTGASCPTRF